ncbi:MAG: transglutaminase-like domain-containing protein [Lachnospiraceae bacterium]
MENGMLSNQLVNYANENYQKRRQLFGVLGRELDGKIQECTCDEGVLLRFLYGTMPLQDAGEYDFSIFLSYVRHGLYLREEMNWCRELPEDLFVQYVLYYRINSEAITDCRTCFYEELAPLVKGKNVEEAVIAINYWCAEHATYQASDNRTCAPITVYQSGSGRCGEESTFAISALRSVGIPARQVYTPSWAHCDDNHAWVEVYMEQEWRFLGACEPEEVLNKGWFLNAASRALLIHSRAFSDFFFQNREELIGRKEGVFFYNSTATYAKTALVTIRVMGLDGCPQAGAEVVLEVPNMAEYGELATLITDAKGEVQIRLGIGDIHIRAYYNECIAQCVSMVQEKEPIQLTLLKKEGYWEAEKEIWTNWEVRAPLDGGVQPPKESSEQKKANREKLNEAADIRTRRLLEASNVPATGKCNDAEDLLKKAGGNVQEINQFLAADDSPQRTQLLYSLSEKDLKDASAHILEDHLSAVQQRGNLEETIYIPYLLCPRIEYEELSPYRSFIQSFFSEQQKELFRNHPQEIWNYITENISYDPSQEYSTLRSIPQAVLQLKQGSLISRRILFVAICRTLGIPARIHTHMHWVQYYQQNTVVDVEEEALGATGELVLCIEGKNEWTYHQNYTIGRWTEHHFETIDQLEPNWIQGSAGIFLNPGKYRILTAVRMPNGNQQLGSYCFQIHSGERRKVELFDPKVNPEDLLVKNKLLPMTFSEVFCEKEVQLSQVLENRMSLLIFLEEGKEPTEHVLNELLQVGDKMKDTDILILFVIQRIEALKDAKIEQVINKIPQIRVFLDAEFSNLEPLARRMYVDPEKLPLMVLIQKEMTGIYGCSGYNVGSVDLALQIARMMKEDEDDYSSYRKK